MKVISSMRYRGRPHARGGPCREVAGAGCAGSRRRRLVEVRTGGGPGTGRAGRGAPDGAASGIIPTSTGMWGKRRRIERRFLGHSGSSP